MNDHEKLNKLVVGTLSKSKIDLSARQIYSHIQRENPVVANRYTFKSFCRLIPALDVKPVERACFKFYRLK